MAAPFSKLRSKLNRAICAYLVSADCGTVDDTKPASSVLPRAFPNTTVRATVGRPEPAFTGNYRIQTHVSVKGSASNSVDETNSEASRLAFDNRVGLTYDALMKTDDQQTLQYTANAITAAGRALAVPVDGTPEAALVAANNADMADFTIIAWYEAGFGDGAPDQEGFDWEEILLFDAVCCPSNVD